MKSVRTLEHIGRELVDSAVKVHTAIGPGLLESAYEACLGYELTCRGLNVRRQVPLPLRYREVEMDTAYRLDLVIESSVVVELKSVEQLLPLHQAQLLSYLKLGDFRLGYLLNFNTRRMKDGIRRMVNDL